MLNSITCDTPIESLIKESDVSGIINSLGEVVDTYINNIKNSFNSEMTSGGFSTKSYYVNSDATINRKSGEVLNNINIDSQFSKWKNDILNALDVQRKKELNKLKTEIENKIEELESELKSVVSSINNAGPKDNVSSLYTKKANLEADIKKYSNKLSQVIGEM